MSEVMAKNKDNNAPCVNPMIINAKYNEFLDAKAMKKRLLQKKKKRTFANIREQGSLNSTLVF
jgi:hypothetical protein